MFGWSQSGCFCKSHFYLHELNTIISLQMTSCPSITRRNNSEGTTVRKLLHQLQNPHPIKSKPKPLKPQLDVQLIRSQMKTKWRDPGYCNIEFEAIPILKAKMLSQWEYERIFQAQRSYKYPKNYKGIRYDSHSRPFQQPSKEALPPKFRDYLNKVEAQYTNSQFGPDPALEQRRSRIRRMLTENSVRSNLATSGMRKSKDGFFGFSAKRFKTLGVQ